MLCPRGQPIEIKTSASHPLRIDEINIPGCRGRIGVTSCPGKKQHDAASGQNEGWKIQFLARAAAECKRWKGQGSRQCIT